MCECHRTSEGFQSGSFGDLGNNKESNYPGNIYGTDAADLPSYRAITQANLNRIAHLKKEVILENHYFCREVCLKKSSQYFKKHKSSCDKFLY